MKPSGLGYWVAVIIALATVLSGALQMFCPALVLGIVGGASDPTSRHFFAIIGMFMVLFGGMAFQGLLQWRPTPMFWSALQKLGASAAVGCGVYRHLFSPVALGVAGFDLISGLLFAWVWLATLSD